MRLKLFEENNDAWEEILGEFDVYQLMELLNFKYGNDMFKDINQELSENEDDYNPEEYYEQIRYKLEENDVFDDFIENYEKYSIEKDENDPFHWRYRKKLQDEFMKKLNWDDEKN